MRLHWKGEEPTSNMHDGRPAAALLGLGSECFRLQVIRRKNMWARLSSSMPSTLMKAFPRLEVTSSKDILVQNAHSSCDHETSRSLLSNVVTWLFQKIEDCLRLKNIREAETSWAPLAQWLCSNVCIANQLMPHPWIVWPVWWLKGSRCMNGSSFRPSRRTSRFS